MATKATEMAAKYLQNICKSINKHINIMAVKIINNTQIGKY